MCYINLGGLGFTLDAAGDIPHIAEHRYKSFRLLDLSGVEYFVKAAPASGWSQVLFVLQMVDCEEMVLENGATEVYLGNQWIGSTEV